MKKTIECPESYVASIVKYQVVVAALTGNEKRHLTTGDTLLSNSITQKIRKTVGEMKSLVP